MTTLLFSLAIKATLLLLAVAAAAVGVRRCPAATRHFVWLSGLAALLLMPVLAVSAPAWSPAWAGDWLPAYLLTDAPRAVAPALSQTPFAAVGSWVTDRPDPSAEVSAGASDTAGSAIVAAQRGPELDGSSGAGALRAALPFWLALAWAGGAVAMTCWLAVGFVRRTRLARRAVPVDGGSMADASDIAAATLGLQRRVRLLLGDSRVVPMTWGIVRPVLFLPAAAEDWSTRRLNTVLLHELAHIKRHDSLSRSLAQLACSVFWFHPLAWISAGRMLREQERACDDVVILAGANPHSYAATLVAIAREFRSPRPSVVGALAFARRSNLEHRLLSILDPLRRRKKLSSFRKAVVLALFLGVALPLAALHPAAVAQEPDAVQKAEQQEKQRPKRAVVVRRADAPAARVGVVIRRPDAPAPRVGVVIRRPDAPAPQVGVVVRRPDAPAPQVAQETDARPPFVVVRQADSANQLQLEAEGLLRLGDDVSAVELADGGWLVITELNQRLEVRPSGGGELDFTFSVDGAEAEFDDEARQWANDILARMTEVGNPRGNVFISLGRGDIDGEVASIVIEPLAFEKLELTAEPMVVLEQLELAERTLALTMEPLELAAETLALTIEPLELAGEFVTVSIEPLELAAETLALTIEPMVAVIEPLEVSVESLELAVEPLDQAFETLELALELPLDSDGRTRRFDRVDTWSEGGSRFVAMRRGPVDIGETVDEIEVGTSGGLVIDERSGDGVHRRLHVFADESGETTFEWFVDGEDTPFDASGRAWLQPVLDWLNENGDGDQPAATR